MKAAATTWKTVWNYLKYLVWLSPCLIVAGLTTGLLSNAWGIVPLSLMGVGLGLAIAWLILYSNALAGFLGQRSTQAGTNALVATLAVIVILGLINFLGVRYATRLDLTENQLFTLAPQSVQVVKELEEPVKVWIFSPTPNPTDQALLDNYRRQGEQFSYEYIDPQSNPGLVQRFGMQAPGEVYLEKGEQRRFVQVVGRGQPLSEQRLTNGIAQLSNPLQAKVYFIQGHGERSLETGQGAISAALSELEGEGFSASPLKLTDTTTIPEDASVVVLAGPQQSLLEPELKAINDYLKRRSGLLVMADPDSNADLDPLLQPWGVKMGDRLIVDPDGEVAGYGAGMTIISQYGSHPITEKLGGGFSLFPVAQPLEVVNKDGITTTPLLITSDRTQAQRINEDGTLSFDPATDFQGQMLLGVALSRPVEDADADAEDASPEPSPSLEASPSPEAGDDEADSAPETRLVIIGNSSFLTDGMVTQQLNKDVFLNSINWLSQQSGESLAVRPKEATNRRILLTGSTQILLSVGAVLFLPIFGFLMAFGIWWLRR